MNVEVEAGIEKARHNRNDWSWRLHDMLAEIRFGNLQDEELDDECHRVRVLFGDLLSENYFLECDVVLLEDQLK